MTILPVPSGIAQGFDEDAWDDLLNYIEERRAIPIVGPDPLRVNTPGGPRPLYEWLAEKLALRLSVDTLGLPRPLALRQLAQITDFDLFVTTTFDPLLEQAINLERYGGQPSAEVIAYAPNRVDDLPVERSDFVATEAALKLGRYAQAEALVRQRLAVPFDSNSDADPVEEASAARSAVAYALATQGRGAEALAELAEATQLISGASTEAQGLAFMRELAAAPAA